MIDIIAALQEVPAFRGVARHSRMDDGTTSSPGELAGQLRIVADELIVSQSNLPQHLREVSLNLRDGAHYAVRVELERRTLREDATALMMERLPNHTVRILDLPDSEGRYLLPPWVVFSVKRPLAWLFIDRSGHGKTSTAIELSERAGLPLYHGDQHLMTLALGRAQGSARLRSVALKGYRLEDWSVAIRDLFGPADLFAEFVRSIPFSRPASSLIFDMWTPAEAHRDVVRHFEELGYFPVMPRFSRSVRQDRAALTKLREEVESLRQQNAARDAEKLVIQADNAELVRRNAVCQQDLAAAEATASELRRTIADYLGSTSWRITRPLRRIAEIMKTR